MSFFNDAYLGQPPWDIGKAQTAFREVAKKNNIKGPIFEVGCGTGENSLFFADLGFDVTGIDAAPRAIVKASQKAKTRDLDKKATFLNYDLFKLADFDKKYNTIIDCGVFHMFNQQARNLYQENVAKILNLGGKLFILAFSYLEPLGIGPSQRLTEEDYFSTFKDQWKVVGFDQVNFETTIRKDQAKGLLTTVEKL